ncbi:MAG: hypothetical protein GVY16_09780 [Planctomycetes bacterium]|jgi:hypothetical protein|nr:hypothetical protein [Planctomycetota bacterium]
MSTLSTINERRKALNANIRIGLVEYFAGWKPWRNPVLYLALLAAPAGIAGIIFYDAQLAATMTAGQRVAFWGHFAHVLEQIGPWLLVAASAIYVAKAALRRNPTYLVIGTMAVCLMLREFHWHPFIKDIIYPLLGGCLVWALVWWKKLDRPARNPWLALLLLTALATYGLAQFTEKRLFEFLPNEDALHTQFEELTEVTAHSLLLLSALASSWRRRKPGAPAEAA